MNDALSNPSPTYLEFGEFQIDPKKRTLARIDGETIALTPKHFDTLLYLVENAGEVLEKDALMSALWPGMVVEENNLSQAISQLRRILGDNGAEHRYILTAPRRGYRFVAEVRKGSAAPEREPDAVDTPLPSPSLPSAPPASMDAIATPVTPVTPPAIAQALSRPIRRRNVIWGASIALVIAAAGIAWTIIGGQSRPGRQTPGDKSIAVMPFANFSGDKADEFFSEGITEDLVTQLAQISELKVISRTSILQYKDSKKPLREIARELGVAHILQGSVRRGENRFRITAQLIDPAREGHLWAKSYDRDIKDVLAVQSEVTGEIAAALKARLLEPESSQLQKRARGNPEAYVLYRKGAHLLAYTPGREKEDRRRAREYFERVIEMDPGSPLGYAGMANFHFASAMWLEETPANAFARAESLAKRAHLADEHSVEANLMLASIYSRGFWLWQKAEPFAKRAIELSPGNAEAWDGYRVNVLVPTGRLEEALAAQRRAVSLDPLSMGKAFGLANVLALLRRCDDAIKQARVNLELDPKFWLQYVVIARCHENRGEYAEAIAAFRKIDRPWMPQHVIDELQALVVHPPAIMDAKAYWRVRFAWSKKHGTTTQNQHYFTAAFAAQAGETDEAFRYLNLAIEQRDREMGATKVDPQLDPLRADPRFHAVLKRLNLD